MINWRDRADQLMEEYNMVCQARPRDNTVDIQIEKESCGRWASHLATQRSWGSDLEIAEACHQLEPRLKRLKDKVIIEILGHGTI